MSEAAALDVIVAVSVVVALVLCPRLAAGRGEPVVVCGPVGRRVGHPAGSRSSAAARS